MQATSFGGSGVIAIDTECACASGRVKTLWGPGLSLAERWPMPPGAACAVQGPSGAGAVYTIAPLPCLQKQQHHDNIA